MKKYLLLLLLSFIGFNGIAQITSSTPTSVYFPATTVGSCSSPQSFVISGSYLTPPSDALTVTAPRNYMVSTTIGGTYSSSMSIDYTGGTMPPTTIYAQFCPSSTGTYNDSAWVTGGGTPTLRIPFYGAGTSSICSGTPIVELATSSLYTVCGPTAITLLDSATFTAAGITFQWQSSPDSATWTDMSGATNQTAATTVTSATYYRVTATCGASGLSATTPGLLIHYSATCPTLSAAPGGISFPVTTSGTSSAAINTVLSGSYLTPSSGSFSVFAPGGFSINDGSAWVTSLSISYTGGAITADTIPVRFDAPGTPGTYHGNLVVSGAGASTLNVGLSGTSSTACTGTPTPGGAVSSISVATTSTPVLLSDTGYSSSSGLTFQWQSSPSGSTFTDITGATNTTYAFTGISASTYYRCNVTCSASSLSAATSAILLTYVAPCSGTPSGGTAASLHAACYTCSDTVTISGFTSGPDITFQWQSSADGSTGWATMPGATTSTYGFTTTGDNYYRCAVTCAATGLTGYSTAVRAVYPYHIITHAVNDSASVLCYGPLFTVMADGASSLLYLKTFYGDGSSDSTHMVGTTTTFSSVHHIYGYSGTYTIKQVLYFNNVAEDSITYPYSYINCRALPLSIFYDANSNGVFDAGDTINTLPFAVEVDSNGTPVDTIHVFSGLYYNAGAVVGTIYSFRLLTSSAFIVTCPSSAVIKDTIYSAVNVYANKYFGFGCGSSVVDYGVAAIHVRSGPHEQSGEIYK